jgi:hypothetical protein
MKKARSNKQSCGAEGELLRKYRFDYSKARPNRFATRVKDGGRQIALDPDVARVFTTQESVNAVLRALIKTMPK